MEDYSSMGYFDLKAECRKKGIDSKGTKIALLERLGAGETTKTPEAPEPEIKAQPPESAPRAINLVAPSQEELNKFLPDKMYVPEVDNSKYEQWLTDARLQKLKNQLDAIAAGIGKCTFQLDYEGGAFQVEFSGRLKDYLESTTLIAPNQLILHKAYCHFNNRLDVGRGH